MENETAKSFKVIVIGAGTTGLLIAQGLKKAGISCAVYERESASTYKDRQREWGMTLHWAMEHLTRCLPDDIIGRLNEARTDPFLKLTGEDAALPVLNGKTGEVILKAGEEFMARVSRRKLRKLLSEGVEVQFGKNLRTLQETGSVVQVTFEDGEEVVGNLVIGSDGPYSLTRGILLGEAAKPKRFEGAVILNFTQSYDAETALIVNSLHPISKTCTHPDGYGMIFLSIVDRHDPAKPETWLFQVFAAWFTDDKDVLNADSTKRLSMLKERAKEFVDPFRTAVLAVKDNTSIAKDSLSYWEPVPWDNRSGKVTLAGDAAHPMLPHRGQGLNNAFEDAANLVDAVSNTVYNGENQSRAIDMYEEEMIPRGGDEVRRSHEQAEATLKFKMTGSPLMRYGVGRVRRESEKNVSAKHVSAVA